MVHPSILWPRTLYEKVLFFLLLFLWFPSFCSAHLFFIDHFRVTFVLFIPDGALK